MSRAQQLHEAIQKFIKALEEELQAVVRQRDGFSERAIDLEVRLKEMSDLELEVRRMP